MSDAGEGLIDAEDRYQQRVAEREQERQRTGIVTADRDRERRLRTLDLAKAELERQRDSTTSAIRLEQIRQALAEIDRQIAAV